LQNSQPTFEDLFHVPATVQNAYDVERFRFGTIYDQIRVNREKFNIFVGQILAHMPSAGSLGEKDHPVTDNGPNMVCNRSVGLSSDVMPDFDKDQAPLPVQAHSARSFRLGF
jgi:hypothetical protein